MLFPQPCSPPPTNPISNTHGDTSSQNNPVCAPEKTSSQPEVSPHIAALSTTAVAPQLYARYFLNSRGGGDLHFLTDGTSKQLMPPQEKIFDSTRNQFKKVAKLIITKATSAGELKTGFNSFRPVSQQWNSVTANTAIEDFLAQQVAAPPQDHIYRDLYNTRHDARTTQPSKDMKVAVDFDDPSSIQRHLQKLGMPASGDAGDPQGLAMFGSNGPNFQAILFNLHQLMLQIRETLPAEYAHSVAEFDIKTLESKMISAVVEHFDKYRDAEAAQLPSVPLRVVEQALHKAYSRSVKAADNARKLIYLAPDTSPPLDGSENRVEPSTYQADLATRYSDYLRELKRFVTTQAAPYHFDLAALQSARRFGPDPQVDDGKTSSSRIGVSGGAKVTAIFTATAGIDLTGNTTDFIDIDGDRNHIRVNGIKINLNLKEGFNKILSLYANQSVSAQYTNGRYLAHADPRSHFHAMYQNYIQHPRRAAIGERFMRWLIDRSADPGKTRVRISMDHFFSELQRFITGTESLSSTDALPRYANDKKMGRGRNACELHRQAREIDALLPSVPGQSRADTRLPTLTSAIDAAVPLRQQLMKSVFGHLDAARRANGRHHIADELKKASTIIDGLAKSPDVPPVPGGANRQGTAEQDPAYWGTARAGASVAAGAGLNSAHYLKALAIFQALSKSGQRGAAKPKLPNFNPSIEFKLETEAAFRQGGLQRLHIDPYKALSPEYLASKPVLLKTMNDVRNMLAQASPDGPHPYLAFVDRFDAFADLRTLQMNAGSVPPGMHARDAWLDDVLRRKKLFPADAAERLTGSYAAVARQMAAFMSVESGALHASPQSAESGDAIRLLNDGFWQGRHTIDPASATREQIDAFLGMTRGMIALACSDIDKNMALVTDAAAGQRRDLSLNARDRFDNARASNAEYARFLSKCFAKGNDLGNEHHARHATVLQPGPSNRDDFTATVTLPSLKIPALNAAIPSGGTLDTALAPVTDNLALLGGVSLTYQSTVFNHPAPLPRSGTGETYTATGKLSLLLGGRLPAMFHAVQSGRAAAAVNAKKPTSGKVANHVLEKFAGHEFPSDFRKVFWEEMDRTSPPKGVFHTIFHALTTSESSGVTVRRFRHPGADQPSLVRDLTWWVETKGEVTVMPEFLAYFQPGTTLKAGGALSGVKHVTLAQRLGNDPFYNSMNFVKSGGLGGRLKRDDMGNVDLQDMRLMFSQKEEACRTWMSGATPGSLGAMVDNYEQLLDFVNKGGPQTAVRNNALGALQHHQWRDIIDNAHHWSLRDPKNETRLEELDEPGLLQRVLNDARAALPFSSADRQALKKMSAQERMEFLVRQRPDVLQTVFKLYTALNTANGFVKNALGYGPAANSLLGSLPTGKTTAAVPVDAPSPTIAAETDDEENTTWL